MKKLKEPTNATKKKNKEINKKTRWKKNDETIIKRELSGFGERK